MSKPVIRSIIVLFGFLAAALAQETVLDCLVFGQDGCLEAELNRALKNAERIQVIKFTRDLALVNTGIEDEAEKKEGGEETTLERLERFLYSHSLRLDMPQELVSGARELIPDDYLSKVPTSLTVPLAEDSEEGRGRKKRRGFIKKVVLPFVLGLKFKTTAVIPIAIGLIAMKTWKALTLGLLSIVLSAALVIFRLTRPKVLNYEVVYPPSHSHHHIVDDHYHARAADSMAYKAYR